MWESRAIDPPAWEAIHMHAAPVAPRSGARDRMPSAEAACRLESFGADDFSQPLLHRFLRRTTHRVLLLFRCAGLELPLRQ